MSLPSFEHDIQKAISDHVKKRVNELVENAVNESVEKIAKALRAEIDSIALKTLAFYSVEHDRNHLIIRVEKKDLK